MQLNAEREAAFDLMEHGSEQPSSSESTEPPIMAIQDFDLDPEHVKAKTGLTLMEFLTVWTVVEEAMTSAMNAKGPAPTFKGQDAFYIFMMHIHLNLNHEKLAAMLKVRNKQAIYRSLQRTLNAIHDPLVQTYIAPLKKSQQREKGEINLLLVENLTQYPTNNSSYLIL